jgi:hypothetical protein
LGPGRGHVRLMLTAGGLGGEGGLSSIIRFASVTGGSRGGKVGGAARVLAGTIGLELAVRVEEGRGGGTGGVSAFDRIAVPGPRSVRTLAAAVLCVWSPPSVAACNSTGGLLAASAPSCISAPARVSASASDHPIECRRHLADLKRPGKEAEKSLNECKRKERREEKTR